MKYFSIVICVSLCIICVFAGHTLSSKISQNSNLIVENQKIISCIRISVDSIDKEQIRRTRIVAYIPTLREEINPNHVDSLSGILKTDSNGVIQEVSVGIEKITGKDEDELIGVSIETLMSEKSWLKHQTSSPLCLSRDIILFNKNLRVGVNYIPTEDFFIVNMKEI